VKGYVEIKRSSKEIDPIINALVEMLNKSNYDPVNVFVALKHFTDHLGEDLVMQGLIQLTPYTKGLHVVKDEDNGTVQPG